MDNSERFEQLIAFVGAQLPKPVEEHQTDDGSFIFTGGEPPEVIVQITEFTVLVAAFVAIPEGGDRSATEPQPVGELHWRRLPETAVMNALSALIKGSREVRLATYRVCLDCGEKRAPEDMAAQDMCRECAEAPPRTVH
jgi:organic radical activating enzyme